jgi:RNA polymerase sigma-70 factor (ECF subfamily)
MKTGNLLTWIAAGDAHAFRRFYDHYILYVTKVVTLYREDETLAVEDLVQEIFLSVWKYRLNLAAVKNIKYYLFTTAKNKVVQFQMAAAKKTNVQLDAVHSHYLQQAPQDNLDYKMLLGIYRETVQSLPLRQQKVFKLRNEEGLSRQEVSAMMGITCSTVKNLNRMAKEKLCMAIGQRMELSI